MAIIHACGFDLPFVLVPLDESRRRSELARGAMLPPSERVERLLEQLGLARASGELRGRSWPTRASVFDPYELLAVLQGRHVSFVVIGAFARVVHGTGELTDGIDITPSMREDNLPRLEKALADLDARRRVDGDAARPPRPRTSRWSSLRRAPASSSSSRAGRVRAATTTSAATPAANRSAAASAPRSPHPTTSPACSAPSTATKTSSDSSASAAS